MKAAAMESLIAQIMDWIEFIWRMKTTLHRPTSLAPLLDLGLGKPQSVKHGTAWRSQYGEKDMILTYDIPGMGRVSFQTGLEGNSIMLKIETRHDGDRIMTVVWEFKQKNVIMSDSLKEYPQERINSLMKPVADVLRLDVSKNLAVMLFNACDGTPATRQMAYQLAVALGPNFPHGYSVRMIRDKKTK